MADIFGYSRTTASDVFTSEKSRLSITGDSGVTGVDLIQSWSLQYQQTLQPIYEVGSSRLFWSKGNPIGQGSIGRIVGASFLSMSGSVCDTGKTITISNASGSCSGGEVEINCTGAICTSVGFSAQAGNPTVAESVAFQFVAMSVTGGANGQTSGTT